MLIESRISKASSWIKVIDEVIRWSASSVWKRYTSYHKEFIIGVSKEEFEEYTKSPICSAETKKPKRERKIDSKDCRNMGK